VQLGVLHIRLKLLDGVSQLLVLVVDNTHYILHENKKAALWR
jgi:hypothetical protein